MSAASAAELERRCELFGSSVSLRIGIPRAHGAQQPFVCALAIEAALRRAHRELTRFDPGSDLSRLNADPASTVDTSPLVASFVAAAAWAAQRSGGLVDATVIGAVESAGYRESRRHRAPADLHAALVAAPERRPALATRPSPWDEVAVDLGAGRITRPPGLRFDTGGIAKGLLADRYAEGLAAYSSFAIDCGGDVRVGGADGLERSLEVADPFSGRSAVRFGLVDGAVATSGLRRRVWRHGDGYAHHLIDPGRRAPAWTGLVQATAVAPTALEAETLAKAALLSGPAAARDHLTRWGGVVFDDRGEPTVYGPLQGHVEAMPEVAAA